MLLWIGFAILTAGVLAALARPLVRQRTEPVDPRGADLAVYRDQLSEIDADVERGLLTANEAEGARAEIARRLLSRAESETPASSTPALGTGALSPWLLRVGAGAITALTLAFYLLAGSPNLPDQPLAARAARSIAEAGTDDLIGKVEARLRAAPDDGRGWEVIAPVYLRLRRDADARHAYSEAIRLLGETPKRLLGLAEANLLADDGIVSEDVRRISERILVLDPARAEPRLWLALAKEQDGKLAAAAADYRQMLATAAPDAPWREVAGERLKIVEDRLSGSTGSGLPAAENVAPDAKVRAPDTGQAAEIAALAPAERTAFIGRMVDGLAARLKTDGKNLAGWLQLVRAFKVLEREADAKRALADARRNFEGDTASLAELDALAKSLGLGS